MLVTDGTDAALLKALRKAAAAEGALVELIAPHDRWLRHQRRRAHPGPPEGRRRPVRALRRRAILASAEGAALLAPMRRPRTSSPTPTPTASSSAYSPDAVALLDAAGVVAELDDGYIELDRHAAIATFIEACRDVRYWARTTVDQT